MPELGKATYTLIFDTRQGEVAVAGMETRAAQASKSIQASMGNAERSVSTLGETTQGAAGEVDTATTTMAGGFGEAGAAATAMGGKVAAGNALAASSSLAGARKSVTAWEGAARRMKSIGGRMKSIGHGLMSKVTLPTLLVGGLATKQALDYNEQIKMIQTQAGGTGKEVEYMNKAILRLAGSGKVTQTPVELAKALFHLESVGVRGRAALDALTSSAHLATVGHADLEESTNALIGAITTGIPGVKSFDQAVGVMNATIGAGNLRMDEFNASMTTGVMKQAALNGVSLQELGASLAEFTSQRLPAVQSMTAMRMSLTQLLKPTKQQVGAMDKLGFAQGRFSKNGLQLAYMIRTKGLVPTMQLIHDRYKMLVKEFGKEQATKVLLTAFGGAKSSKAMLALVTGSEDLRKKYIQVNKASMDFAHLTAVAMGEPVNKMKANLAQMSASLIKIGVKLVPIVAKLVHGISRLFEWFDKLSPKTQKWILIAIGIAAVLGPVLSILGGMVALVGGIIALGAGFAAVSAVVLILGGAFVYAYIRSRRFRNMLHSIIGFLRRHKTAMKALALTFGVWFGLIRLAKLFGFALRVVRGRLFGVAAGEKAVGRAGIIARLRVLGLRGALMALGSTVVLAAIAAAVYAVLKLRDAWNEATEAMERADVRENSKWGQEVSLYDGLVKIYRHRGMTQAQAEARANAVVRDREHDPSFHRPGGNKYAKAYRKRFGDGQGGGDTAARRRRRRRRRHHHHHHYDPGADPRLDDPGDGDYTPPGSLDDPEKAKRKKKRKKGRGRDGKASLGILGPEWMHLQDAYLRAQTTKTHKDDLRALRAEERFLRKTLRNPKISEKKRHEALQQLVMVNRALKRLNKTAEEQKKISAKAAMEFATTRGSFFDQFASNIFHRTANGKLALGSAHHSNRTAFVHQHNIYNEIPKDRYHHARRMREAMNGALE